MRRRRLVGRRNAHQPGDREPVGFAAGLEERIGLLRQHARLLRLGAGVDLDEQGRLPALPGDLLGQRLGEARRGRPNGSRRTAPPPPSPCSTAAARPGAARCPGWLRLERRPLGLRLLHAVLAEHALAGGDHRLDRLGAEGLRDRHQRHRGRIAPGLGAGARDLGADLRQRRFADLRGSARHGVGNGSCRALPRQQRALALDAPAIARERAVRAHHAVAGNGDRERVRARRPAPPRAPLSARRCARRSRRSSRSSRPGSSRSACQTRCWNAVPRTSSGRSRPSAGASTKPTTFATSCSKPASPPTSRACGKRSCRSRTSASGSSPSRIAQTPLSRRRHQDRAERALADREADRRCPRRRRGIGRRHAEQLGRRRVEAAAGVEAGAIDRLGHGVAARRAPSRTRCGAMRVGVGLGRHAGDAP